MKRNILPLLLAGLLAGCGPKPVTRIYDESRVGKIECLKLRVVPPDSKLERFMQKRYPFETSCKTVLEITTKCGIVCNSNQNAPRKNLSAFPDSYLRMEVRESLRLLYSYYVDLQGEVDEKALERGWERLRRDLKLTP